MKHNVNVECLDNGWLIRWSRSETDEERAARYSQASYPPRMSPKTQGTEIFTKHKDMLARIKTLTE